ncbi:hypothetical protein CBS101457_005701 [Exobasidium rhododendri]|nr:hypothetical protein CBS101457_005701 [Exobasidium rhododendri]
MDMEDVNCEANNRRIKSESYDDRVERRNRAHQSRKLGKARQKEEAALLEKRKAEYESGLRSVKRKKLGCGRPPLSASLAKTSKDDR